jgi:hypothetical protein
MYMHNSNKKQGSIAIVIAVIIALLAVFGVYECSRLSELKNNLPVFVVKKSEEEARISAIVLAAVNNDVYVRSVGTSNSLYLPFENSYITLHDAPYEDLKKHDFVAYINKNKVKVFHRLIKKTYKGWIAMGDNNSVEDTTRVTKNNYIGRLVEPIFTWESAITK